MRVAVFSDIHGNPFSLSALLKDFSIAGDFDAIVMAGDACTGGSDPAGCVDMLKAAGIQAVYGNADEFIFASPKEPPADIYRPHWKETMMDSKWAAEKIGRDRLNWLRSLPFDLRFSPTQHPRDDLLVVHANPINTFTHILPPETVQRDLFGEVEQPDNDPHLMALLEGVKARMIAFGHFHYTSERLVKKIRLVNVSFSSYSQLDKDRSARYTIFTWKSRWQVERRYVAYDFHLEKKALLETDMPGRDGMIPFFE